MTLSILIDGWHDATCSDKEANSLPEEVFTGIG